jgi:hypothetical protein
MSGMLVWSLPSARLMLLVWPSGIVVYDFDVTFKTCLLPTQSSVRMLYRDVSRPSWLEMYISIEQRELMIEKQHPIHNFLEAHLQVDKELIVVRDPIGTLQEVCGMLDGNGVGLRRHN